MGSEWLLLIVFYHLPHPQALRMLRTWRKAAKAQAFARVRKSLEGRLLLAKPDFCYSILDLQAKVKYLCIFSDKWVSLGVLLLNPLNTALSLYSAT